MPTKPQTAWMLSGVFTWAALLSVVTAWWMAPHVLPLRAETIPAASREWTATHSLRVDCGCSAEVFRHLSGRGAQPGWRERVLLNRPQPEWTTALHDAGFEVVVTTVRSGPRLALSDPSGRTWQGGYAKQRPQLGVELEDLSLMRSFHAGSDPNRLPAYGCASNNQ
jgi:hypothetical protein